VLVAHCDLLCGLRLQLRFDLEGKGDFKTLILRLMVK